MIDRPCAYNSVLLVQACLADPSSKALRQQAMKLLAEGAGRILVFFHAEAAALGGDEERGWARLAGSADISLAVCQAARARRVASAPEAPFEVSSLVRFWDAVLRSQWLHAPQRCAVGSGGFVIRLAHQVAEPEAREYLELVLAGASLELDLVVLFESDGLGLLAEERARPWGQLVDHGLARLVTDSANPLSPLLEPVDTATIEFWRATRNWIEP